MADRIDTASRLIRAAPPAVYRAFAAAEAFVAWLPPEGMTGTLLAFGFREGGGFRMRLTYTEPEHTPGKTADDADDVKARFVRLVPDERIEQAVEFESDDPAYAGVMRMTWTFEAVDGGTLATVRCEDVPAGIDPGDHEVGLTSTLGNLAVFVERRL